MSIKELFHIFIITICSIYFLVSKIRNFNLTRDYLINSIIDLLILIFYPYIYILYFLVLGLFEVCKLTIKNVD